MTPARRLLSAAAGLVLTAALAGTAGCSAADLGISTRPPAPTTGRVGAAAPVAPVPDAQTQRETALEGLLRQRARAVATRDARAWMATVDDPGSAFGQRQARAFANLLQLPVTGFTYSSPVGAPELSPTRAAAAGPGAWVAKVEGSYELAGFDRSPRTFETYFTVVRRAGGWRLADDTDGGTQLQMWDLPGMRVLRGRTSLVVGNAPAARMSDYRAQADAGVARVRAVWGSAWNSHVVLVTPATTAEFGQLLQRDSKGLEQVAAVTVGVIAPGQTAGGDRIVVNPTAFSQLQPLGRRVVITHELTHVAARSSTTRPVPVWLSEGMADYVGYLGLDLPRTRVAAELLALVRKGRGPRRLPTTDDFDPTRTTIAPTYTAAWLACSRIADRYGQRRLVALYRAAAGDLRVPDAIAADPDAVTARAFPAVLGVSEPRFVADWLAYLSALARQ